MDTQVNPNDPTVIALSKAIFHHESGGDFNAVGDAGTSHGAGQWQAPTWKAQAKDILGDENSQMTPENQKAVIQGTVAKRKAAGLNPAQIAAEWNSGSPEGWEKKIGTTTINGQQIKYDVPAYVKSVTDLYQQYKTQGASQQKDDGLGAFGQNQPLAQPQAPSSMPQAPAATSDTSGGDWLDKTTNFVNAIFPGKQVGQAIGTLGGYLLSPNKENYDTSAPSPLQVAGDVAQGALAVGTEGLGQTGALAGKVFGKALPAITPAKTALGVIGRNVAGGAGIGAANAVANGGDLGDIAKQGAIGAGLGGLAGGAITGAGAIAARGTPEKIAANRYAELTKLERNNAPIRKVIAAGDAKGIDTKKILADSDLLVGAVDKNGTINTQDAIGQMQDFLKPQEDVIRKNLVREGKTIPLTDVEAKLKQAVNDSGVQGGALTRALRNVDDDIAGYGLKADANGNVPLSLIQDAKVDKYSNINYLNPETKRVDKTIAKGLKQIVEDNTDSVDVKELNKELSKHFATISVLEKLDGKKVEGGRLGKYFAQTVGSIVGSTLPLGPLGPIAGAEIGGRIMGRQMAGKFGKATGQTLESSPAMKNAIELAKSRKLPVKQLPSSFDMQTIDAGPGAVSKFQKPTGLPTAEGAPNVYGPSYEKHIPHDKLPAIDAGKGAKSKFQKASTDLPVIR